MKTFAALLHHSRLADASILPSALARPGPGRSSRSDPFYHERWRVHLVGSVSTLGEQQRLHAQGSGYGDPLGPVEIQIDLSLVPFEDGRPRLHRAFRATGRSRSTTAGGDVLVIGFVGTLRCEIVRDDDPSGGARVGFELAWQTLPDGLGTLSGAIGAGIIRGRSHPEGGYHGQTTGTLARPASAG
ncbi:MAG: hypothetical protein KF833_10610 [Verrucomicrobiae bacterium]|nr:hypothetical protein [Verrucomicrobiae bacterium]